MPRRVVTIFLFFDQSPILLAVEPSECRCYLAAIFFLPPHPPMFFHSIFSSHKVCVTDRLNAGTEFEAVICVFTAS